MLVGSSKTMFVKAVSATTWRVKAAWIGSPTMKWLSMFRPELIATELARAWGIRFQPAASGTCLAYQRARDICIPVWRSSSTNWTW